MGTAVIGAPEFRARNGLIVKPCDNGGVEVGKPGYRDYTPPEATFALEEWFQAKRDAELGRWRWPANPDYVVYGAKWLNGYVTVVNERTGEHGEVSLDWIRKCVQQGMDAAGDDWEYAALAYAEANPEKHPWHAAEQGDVWVLTVMGHTRAWSADGEGHFQHLIDIESLTVTDPAISAGRRIWPEDAS